MVLKMRGRTNNTDSYVKSIKFKLSDASFVELYRNITEYCIDQGYFEMKWIGCYYEGARGHDYTLKPSYFKDAQIVDIVINEDAPNDYEFFIDFWSAADS